MAGGEPRSDTGGVVHVTQLRIPSSRAFGHPQTNLASRWIWEQTTLSHQVLGSSMASSAQDSWDIWTCKSILLPKTKFSHLQARRFRYRSTEEVEETCTRFIVFVMAAMYVNSTQLV